MSLAHSTSTQPAPPSALDTPAPQVIGVVPALLGTLVFNTLIAVFLSVIGLGAEGRGFIGVLPHNLIWSHCIGLSVAVMTVLAIHANRPGPRRVIAVVGAVTAGTAVGMVLAPMLLGVTLDGLDSSVSPWQPLFIGLFFGGIASAFFWLRERNANLAAEIEAREVDRIEGEKRLIEAQLKMLQAQIEPHFLFNTLANVSSLIQRDPALAGTLLDALNRYLRASLVRTRSDGGTLGDEMDLLRAYLDILRIRMGKRLAFAFDVSDDLRSHPFPPMLLQPLVENAITHGLECKIEGGTVTVSATGKDGALVVSVSDDGLGIQESTSLASSRSSGTAGSSGTGGVGLSNIRARLDALFGRDGGLALQPRVGAGMTAVVTIPLEART